MADKKALKKLLKDLESQGFRIESRKKGLMVYPPNPQVAPVTIHQTPSDHRAWANQLARLRRAGYRD